MMSPLFSSRRLCLSLAVLAFLCGKELSAQPQLYDKHRPAVLKLSIEFHGKKLSSGTAFFISEQGLAVTSGHLLRQAFRPGHSLILQDSKAKERQLESLESCTRAQDFCFFKVKGRATQWFSLKKQLPQPGEKVWVIGHPKGYDFSLSEGIVSSLRGQGRDEEIQISAPISPGSSGAPVFDPKGILMGMASWLHGDQHAQNLNFAISVNSLLQAFEQKPKMRKLADAIEHRRRLLLHRYQSWHKRWSQPALKRLAQGKLPAQRFHTLKASFAGIEFQMPLPSLFKSDSCSQTQLHHQLNMECEGRDGSSVYLKWLRSDENGFKRLMSESRKAVPIREASLFSLGSEERNTLASRWIREELYSQPEAWQCGSWHSDKGMLADARFCQRKVENREHAGFRAFDTLFFQKKYNIVIVMTFLMPEPEAIYFFHSAPKIAFGGMKYKLASEI